MREIRRVDEEVDNEGWIIRVCYYEWDCNCGAIVQRLMGQSDVVCRECGQWYNETIE